MALVAFWAGELLAEAIAVRKGREQIVPSRPIGRPWETRATYWFLVVVGVLLIIASIGSDFSQRGTVTGQGVIQLFGYSAPLAIAVGMLNRHWGSRFLAAVSLGLMAFLIAEGIRTPLLIIAAAAGVRYLYSTRKQALRPARDRRDRPGDLRRLRHVGVPLGLARTENTGGTAWASRRSWSWRRRIPSCTSSSRDSTPSTA